MSHSNKVYGVPVAIQSPHFPNGWSLVGDHLVFSVIVSVVISIPPIFQAFEPLVFHPCHPLHVVAVFFLNGQ